MAILTENKAILLAKGIKNGGIVRSEDAQSVWSSKEAARMGMMSLDAWGYIKTTNTPGVFRVVKAPRQSFDMAKHMMDADTAEIRQTNDCVKETADIDPQNDEMSENAEK